MSCEPGLLPQLTPTIRGSWVVLMLLLLLLMFWAGCRLMLSRPLQMVILRMDLEDGALEGGSFLFRWSISRGSPPGARVSGGPGDTCRAQLSSVRLGPYSSPAGAESLVPMVKGWTFRTMLSDMLSRSSAQSSR